MRYKKTKFSTQLNELYGDEKYIDHIEVGRSYWYFWGSDSDVYQYTKQHWNKIRITYIRSGAVVYILEEFPDYPERYFSDKCFMAMTLVYAEINPVKDLNMTQLSLDDEYTKEDLEKRYCFDDERTVVLNWDNSEESEIDEEELSLIDIVKMNVTSE